MGSSTVHGTRVHQARVPICLLLLGGSVIKQMSAESGAQIRILPRDKLPPCASAADELVQVVLMTLFVM